MEELTYDPEREVDAGEWLGLDEGERIALVASYPTRLACERSTGSAESDVGAQRPNSSSNACFESQYS
jgi:hypothetical protein